MLFKSKDKAKLSHFVLALILLLSVGWTICMDFPLSHCWSSDPFMKEIYRASGGNQARRSDISDITNRYIPPGSNLRGGLDFLKDRGFGVYQSVKTNPRTGNQMVPDGEVRYTARHNRNPFVLVRVTTIVVIESDGERVLRTDGNIGFTGF